MVLKKEHEEKIIALHPSSLIKAFITIKDSA